MNTRNITCRKLAKPGAVQDSLSGPASVSPSPHSTSVIGSTVQRERPGCCHLDCLDTPPATNTAQDWREGFEAGSSGLLPAVEAVMECGEGWGVGPVSDELTVGGEDGGVVAAGEPDP